jgi:hypothetical protein
MTRVVISCDVTSCSQLKVTRRFGATCRLHTQGRRVRQARHQDEVGSKKSSGFYSPTLRMRTTYSMFITTAVRTPNATLWYHYLPRSPLPGQMQTKSSILRLSQGNLISRILSTSKLHSVTSTADDFQSPV